MRGSDFPYGDYQLKTSYASNKYVKYSDTQYVDPDPVVKSLSWTLNSYTLPSITNISVRSYNYLAGTSTVHIRDYLTITYIDPSSLDLNFTCSYSYNGVNKVDTYSGLDDYKNCTKNTTTLEITLYSDFTVNLSISYWFDYVTITKSDIEYIPKLRFKDANSGKTQYYGSTTKIVSSDLSGYFSLTPYSTSSGNSLMSSPPTKTVTNGFNPPLSASVTISPELRTKIYAIGIKGTATDEDYAEVRSLLNIIYSY